MRNKTIVLGSVLAALVLAGACADNDTQSNPSFETGGKGGTSSQAGKTALPEGGEPAENGGGGRGGSLSPSAGEGPVSPSGGSPEAGAGGAPEVPPYDCVLHPKTHLEIINACTDAERIEKHPELPAIP